MASPHPPVCIDDRGRHLLERNAIKLTIDVFVVWVAWCLDLDSSSRARQLVDARTRLSEALGTKRCDVSDVAAGLWVALGEPTGHDLIVGAVLWPELDEAPVLMRLNAIRHRSPEAVLDARHALARVGIEPRRMLPLVHHVVDAAVALITGAESLERVGSDLLEDGINLTRGSLALLWDVGEATVVQVV